MKNNRDRHVAVAVVLLLSLLVSVPPAFSQSDHPWSISVVGGFKSKPGAQDLEEAMRTADFDDTSTGFLGSVDHPFSRGGGSALAADLSYTIRERWAVGFAYIRGAEGRVHGAHGNPTFQFLSVRHSVTTFAPKFSRVLGVAYAGAGPAFHRVEVAGEDGSVQQMSGAISTSTKLGFIAEAGLKVPILPSLPAGIRIIVDVKGQYRYVGKATAGPYTPAVLFGGNPATFPATQFSLNDWIFGVGPGLRF